jgi:hypothetical protein
LGGRGPLFVGERANSPTPAPPLAKGRLCGGTPLARRLQIPGQTEIQPPRPPLQKGGGKPPYPPNFGGAVKAESRPLPTANQPPPGPSRGGVRFRAGAGASRF